MKKIALLSILIFIILLPPTGTEGSVIKEKGKTFLIDRTGERWDITQAVSIGFRASGFQFGIGKTAFSPLDDAHLSDQGKEIPDHLRVIGVDDGELGKAYSIRRLSRHEISNSEAKGKPVAVGY